MLNIKVGNSTQLIEGAYTFNIKAGDKIEITPSEGTKYQVLTAENGKDVILTVTEENGSTYDVLFADLAAHLEAGDIITQLLLNLEDETLTVTDTTGLLEALAATAAGGSVDQNSRGLGEDAPNIDPNRYGSAADDSDSQRAEAGLTTFTDTEGNDRPSVPVNIEITDIEVVDGLNIITGQFTAFDPDIGDTHTFAIVERVHWVLLTILA